MTEHDKNYKLCNDSKMKRKTPMHNNLIVYVGLSFIALMACYCVYGQLFDKSESSELFFSDVDHVKIGDVNKKMTLGRSEIENMDKMGALPFGKAKYIIHIHKLSYRLDLYEKGKKDAIKRYGIAVARNSGDKQKRGDNRTPTSWGTDVAIPKKYEGAKPNVQSSVVPFEVEEVCEASSWTHDFNDGKGVIQGAYGPWFISLDTGWDGIGIHGTHDPKSIGTKASEGCIRLVNSDVDELKRIICSVNNGVGTKVIITED